MTVGGGTCESGYFPMTAINTSYSDCFAAAKDVATADFKEGVDFSWINRIEPCSYKGAEADLLQMEWWPEMPHGCWYDSSQKMYTLNQMTLMVVFKMVTASFAHR